MNNFIKKFVFKVGNTTFQFNRNKGKLTDLFTSTIKRAGSPVSYTVGKMPPTPDLKAVINDLTSKNKVMVFSKTTCPFCIQVKELFSSIKVDYKAMELDTESNGTALQHALAEMTGQRTVPSVFINGKHLDWLRVGGQGLYYKLSRIEYAYCYAKYLCENKRRGQLFTGGSYTYMGLLGKELGITGRMKVEFWLDSPGVSCPSGKEEGSVMQYSGPYVHIAANKSAQFQFMMFCMSDKPGTTTQTQSSTQETYTSPSITTQQTYTLSSSAIKQTYTSSSSATKQTYTSSSSTTKQTYTSSSSTTKQTYTSSSSTTKPTYTSSSSTTKPTYTSSSSTTKPTYTSSSSTTKPIINFKAKVNTLALSKTSGEPAWLKVGKKKYFINYNCSVYKQTSSSVNYYRIFSNPVSKANTFWIGAHIITDEDLRETDVDLVPFKNEPVQFKLTKEHVQSMWKHLRQQRKPSPVNDGNAGG